LKLHSHIERWPLITPFRITGYQWDAIETLLVTLEKDGCIGRGEASGVYYRGETVGSMQREVEAVRASIEQGIDRTALQGVLPPGGARNAVDCAMWDLEAQLSGEAAWQSMGLKELRRLAVTYTCSADEPEQMAACARSYHGARAIKLKLTGEPSDAQRVRAVRAAREDVELRIDANQGFSLATLHSLMPALVEARVTLIEQPFPVGQDALLDAVESPIPMAADESMQCLEDIARLQGRFDVINIKLDKCGGLTEALHMAQVARERGLATMVGNMLGTSLAMAPGVLLGQFCDTIELDAPLALKRDRADPVQYVDGLISSPAALWGGPRVEAG
jgi:L-alanine-DL-glutamate epimerase-like enolase superfamily enzyme